MKLKANEAALWINGLTQSHTNIETCKHLNIQTLNGLHLFLPLEKGG